MNALSRLLAGVFAVQLVLTGFCLLTADAHEISQSVRTQDVHAHCAKSNVAGNQQSGDHSDNCYHCDQPDQLSSSSIIFIAPVALLLPGDFGLAVAHPQLSEATGLIATRMATGPPRSSSLLYRISQRILV